MLQKIPDRTPPEGQEGAMALRKLLQAIWSKHLLHIWTYASLLGFLISQPLLLSAQAHETVQVIVPGTDPGWTRIAVVPANKVIQVRATGTVKFGFFSTTDTASAGVENNPFIQRLKALLRGNQTVAQTNSMVRGPTMDDFWKTSRRVNFSQGGVWIRIVTLKAHNELMPANLYYFWEKFYNEACLKFSVPVEVYAKVHDGGRLPEGRRCAYADNLGSYTVWLDLLTDQNTLQKSKGSCS
jgi:hypothetical protein